MPKFVRHKKNIFINAKLMNRLHQIHEHGITPNALRMAAHAKLSGDCWEWQGHLMKLAGYGQVSYGGIVMGAHRAMLMESTGVWMPAHIFACHKCDNRKCINPDHLFWGTAKDNMQDCKRKGRHSKGPGLHGEQIKNSKLTNEIVSKIRSYDNSVTHTSIGRMFGVSRTVIAMIRSGKAWKHTLTNKEKSSE